MGYHLLSDIVYTIVNIQCPNDFTRERQITLSLHLWIDPNQVSVSSLFTFTISDTTQLVPSKTNRMVTLHTTLSVVPLTRILQKRRAHPTSSKLTSIL